MQRIPTPSTFEDYDESDFATEEVVYSSFTYRIDAVRILGKILALSRVGPFDFQAVEGVDGYLVNWTLHLPEAKRQLLSDDGDLDEMLFQAHMIASA